MSLVQQLFRRFRDNQATAEEQRLVNGWYHSFDNNPDEVMSPKDVAIIEEAIRVKIRQTAGASLSGWPATVEHNHPKTKIISLSRFYAVAVTIAAMLILAATGWWLFSSGKNDAPSYTYLSVPAHITKKITLPDGSQIIMQPGSSLSFPTAFDGDNREVDMSNGEVFYEIARDTTRPFLIHTGNLDVKVLGTAFAIRTISGIREQEVVVKHGKVQVSHKDSLLGTLTAGAGLLYDTATGKTTIRTNQLLLATQLEEGWLVLNNLSFKELQQLLQHRYAVTIEDPRHKLSSAHFSTLFKPHSQVQEIMDVLCTMQGVQYTLHGNIVTIH